LAAQTQPLLLPRGVTAGLWLACAACGAWALAVALVAGPPTVDDAYMFARYARNLIETGQVAWNAGDPSAYGVTSLGYLAALLPWVAAGLAPETALLWASWTSGVAATVVLGVLARPALDRLGDAATPAALLAVSVVLLASPTWIAHMTSGMDTTLAVLAVAVLALSARRAARPDSGPGAVAAVVAAAYLAFLVRPDCGLYATLVAPGLIVATRGRGGLRRAAITGLAIGAVIALDAALKTWLLGDALPLSHYAKRSGFYVGYMVHHRWNPAAYLMEFLQLVGPFVVVVAAGLIGGSTRMRVAAWLLPVALTFAYLFTVVQIMGDDARFFLPALPLFVAAAADAAAGIAWNRRGLVRVAILAVVGVGSWLAVNAWWPARHEAALRSRNVPVPVAEVRTPTGERPPRASEWETIRVMAGLVADLPAGVVIAASEYGLVGAAAPHVRILDMVGLHDPAVAHHGFDAARLLAAEPALVWLPPEVYTGLRAAVLDEPAFWRDYAYYPGVFVHGIAVRRTGPFADEVSRKVAGVWEQATRGGDIETYRGTRR
jgi:hypothetical protein